MIEPFLNLVGFKEEFEPGKQVTHEGKTYTVVGISKKPCGIEGGTVTGPCSVEGGRPLYHFWLKAAA